MLAFSVSQRLLPPMDASSPKCISIGSAEDGKPVRRHSLPNPVSVLDLAARQIFTVPPEGLVALAMSMPTINGLCVLLANHSARHPLRPVQLLLCLQDVRRR
jgi:hypothetical protein